MSVAPHIFSAKICELDIVLTRSVNILTTNKLIKLTMLWTTGPWNLVFLSLQEQILSFKSGLKWDGRKIFSCLELFPLKVQNNS